MDKHILTYIPGLSHEQFLLFSSHSLKSGGGDGVKSHLHCPARGKQRKKNKEIDFVVLILEFMNSRVFWILFKLKWTLTSHFFLSFFLQYFAALWGWEKWCSSNDNQDIVPLGHALSETRLPALALERKGWRKMGKGEGGKENEREKWIA